MIIARLKCSVSEFLNISQYFGVIFSWAKEDGYQHSEITSFVKRTSPNTVHPKKDRFVLPGSCFCVPEPIMAQAMRPN